MSIFDEVTNAMTCHATWKNRLSQVIELSIVDSPIPMIRSDRECAFGKWIHGDTFNPADKQSIHYEKVVSLHSEFHRQAARIMELVETGDKQGAKELMGIGSEYASVSSALLLALINWKRSLLSSEGKEAQQGFSESNG